jgi:hypothetical protein
MSSFMLCTGSEGCTTIISGAATIWLTGVKLVNGS